MLMLRRRKMMMLSMTLRRKTDPKTGKHTLCEPAQSKCTWTCHKRHFVQKIPGKMPDANPAASILCDPTQSKCTWTCHKRHFVRKFTGKMPDVRACAVEMHMDMSQQGLCAEIYREHAKHCSFGHSLFARACAVEMHIDMSQEAF